MVGRHLFSFGINKKKLYNVKRLYCCIVVRGTPDNILNLCIIGCDSIHRIEISLPQKVLPHTRSAQERRLSYKDKQKVSG